MTVFENMQKYGPVILYGCDTFEFTNRASTFRFHVFDFVI